ncbi:hypothetical protein LTR62_006113 [Meristemomyces frigidus]|uniref:AB hydrolase-1 domain-containing protein n=1 Tax=Meristemomyces frigidus TaxID=1508187 RepID=A0AAN7TDC6_9PEZI|nr:hypothetical protein LTR62_006113 [Meristemomyces frigidus]
MSSPSNIPWRLGTIAGAAVGIYAILLGALLTPQIQRFALYANKINTLWLGDDLNDPEAYGFAPNQVTPFNLRTADGEVLYAWHVLPLDVYTRNEKALRAEERPHRPVEDFTKTSAFRLLTEDDTARVVVTFHGNAGHIAQGWRTDTYRNLALQANTHILTIDYRGFGHSTGSPSEAGLVTDGTALIDYIIRELGIPPSRMLILGQSLGTAVCSAVALHFADPQNSLIAAEVRNLRPAQYKTPTAFAGVVLVAPFSSLPSLMLTYRIGGLLPILLPLRPFPWLATRLTSTMADKWLSAERLEAYYHSLSNNTSLLSAVERNVKGVNRSMGSLQLVHSRRDMDIPYHQTETICRRIFGEGAEPGVYEEKDDGGKGVKCIDGTHGATMLDVKAEGRPRVRFEIVEYGGEFLLYFSWNGSKFTVVKAWSKPILMLICSAGHNRIITYSQVAAAINRAFEDLFD